MTQYRIVTDRWAGYEVQQKTWWWPFWVQGRTNTHHSVEKAEAYAMQRALGVVPPSADTGQREVKRLGTLPPPPNNAKTEKEE